MTLKPHFPLVFRIIAVQVAAVFTADAAETPNTNTVYQEIVEIDYGTSMVGSKLHLNYPEDWEVREIRWLRSGQTVTTLSENARSYTTTPDDLGSYIQGEVKYPDGSVKRSATIGPIRNYTLTASNEIVATQEEFQFECHSTFAPLNSYQQLYTFRSRTYFVWINPQLQPMIGARDANGVVTTHLIDPLQSYTVRDDIHYHFSLGIDKNGYIHVAGGHHNFPNADDVLEPRFAGASNMYWVSKHPEDISSFEFVGNTSRRIPTNVVSYLSFLNDQDNQLYAKARVYVHNEGHYSGEVGFGFYKYDTTTKQWKAMGDFPPDQINPDTAAIIKSEFPVILWEDNGSYWSRGNGTKSWYQGFATGIRFDLNNRMHITTGVSNDNLFSGATHVIYARSDDGGESFHRADGSRINPLPIRVDEGQSRGDIVADRNSFKSEMGFDALTTPTFDRRGSPLIQYSPRQIEGSSFINPRYKYWNHVEKQWSASYENPVSGYFRNWHQLDANGVVTFLGNQIFDVYRSFEFGEDGYLAKFCQNQKNYSGVDQGAIKESDMLRSMSVSENAQNASSLHVKLFSLCYEPILDPLPNTWKTISLNSSEATVGSFNNIYHFLSDGTGFSETSRSTQFTYQRVSGDFEILARVVNINFTDVQAFAGLMLTEGLIDMSTYYAATTTSANGLHAYTFESTGDYDENLRKFIPITSFVDEVTEGHPPAEWLKIVRVGDSLTAYHSPNGVNWTKFNERTLELSNSLLIGVVSGGINTLGRARIDYLQVNSL